MNNQKAVIDFLKIEIGEYSKLHGYKKLQDVLIFMIKSKESKIDRRYRKALAQIEYNTSSINTMIYKMIADGKIYSLFNVTKLTLKKFILQMYFRFVTANRNQKNDFPTNKIDMFFENELSNYANYIGYSRLKEIIVLMDNMCKGMSLNEKYTAATKNKERIISVRHFLKIIEEDGKLNKLFGEDIMTPKELVLSSYLRIFSESDNLEEEALNHFFNNEIAKYSKYKGYSYLKSAVVILLKTSFDETTVDSCIKAISQENISSIRNLILKMEQDGKLREIFATDYMTPKKFIISTYSMIKVDMIK